MGITTFFLGGGGEEIVFCEIVSESGPNTFRQRKNHILRGGTYFLIDRRGFLIARREVLCTSSM
jgi:hypothetical protein